MPQVFKGRQFQEILARGLLGAHIQTTTIINTLSNEATNDRKVLVNLTKLLLDEVNKSELSSLKGLIEVQKKVTDNLVSENERLQRQNMQLKDRLSTMECLVDENEQHDRNINLVLRGIPEDPPPNNPNQRENTTKKFVDALNQHFDEPNKLSYEDIARSHRLGKQRQNNNKP